MTTTFNHILLTQSMEMRSNVSLANIAWSDLNSSPAGEIVPNSLFAQQAHTLAPACEYIHTCTG